MCKFGVTDQNTYNQDTVFQLHFLFMAFIYCFQKSPFWNALKIQI